VKRQRGHGYPKCSVSVCPEPVYNQKTGYCKAHHAQFRRNGYVNHAPIRKQYRKRRGDGARHLTTDGYWVVNRPGHPLANTNNYVRQHQLLVWDRDGDDTHPHQCFWCSSPVFWFPGPGQEQLVVDHVNGIKSDNTLDNLAPCCHCCNNRRARGLAILPWTFL
jgi:hypothetical protein